MAATRKSENNGSTRSLPPTQLPRSITRMPSFPASISNSRHKTLWPWGGAAVRAEARGQDAPDGGAGRQRDVESAQGRADESAGWKFEAGERLSEGRSVLKRLGG
jgi:hypothetical protein